MITPNRIDVSRPFVGSSLQKSEKETIARNIVVISQIIAEAKDSDSWHPFSLAEYIGVRGATSEEPVGVKERDMLGELATGGYLAANERGEFAVTEAFLNVVADFTLPEDGADPAAY